MRRFETNMQQKYMPEVFLITSARAGNSSVIHGIWLTEISTYDMCQCVSGVA